MILVSALPVIDGILDAEQVCASGEFIARQQSADGSIPWFVGSHLDPWDHVESAMGLTVVGRFAEAEAAYEWSKQTQRSDGSWPMVLRGNEIEDAAGDTNQCAYLAVGVWHFYLSTGRTAFLAHMWPTIERAMNFVVHAQAEDGLLGWAVSPSGQVDPTALVTGSASVVHSLECACAIAATLGHDRPRWRAARRALVEALLSRESEFADKARFSMDWYYPVLAGVMRDEAAEHRLAERWAQFRWDGHGTRCVDDQPWITAAESAEFVATLDAVGRTDDAITVLREVQSLRDPETGGYWTGRNVVNDQVWPLEQTAWTTAAVLIGADAVTQTTGGAAIFRDAGTLLDRLAEGAAS